MNPFPELKTTLVELGGGVWAIDQEMVRSFIIVGDDSAVLMDAGASDCDMEALVREVTELPFEVVMTHTDGDHTASLGRFAACRLHESEFDRLREQGIDIECLPIADGDVIDLGGRRLEAVHIPGHTPGSMAYIDSRERILFSGDSVSHAAVFMFGGGREPERYIESLEKLKGMADRFDTVYPCHGELPVSPDAIDGLIACVKGTLAGNIEPMTPGPDLPPGAEAKMYMSGDCSIFF